MERNNGLVNWSENVINCASPEEFKETVKDVESGVKSKAWTSANATLESRTKLSENHTIEEDRVFYEEKINALIDKLQVADSKCKAFYAESNVLRERLRIAEDGRSAAEDELAAVKQTVISLKEELETTAINYEDQLSTMSEHLVTMNEKLTSQRDEIDSLKLELKSKVGPTGVLNAIKSLASLPFLLFQKNKSR